MGRLHSHRADSQAGIGEPSGAPGATSATLCWLGWGKPHRWKRNLKSLLVAKGLLGCLEEDSCRVRVRRSLPRHPAFEQTRKPTAPLLLLQGPLVLPSERIRKKRRWGGNLKGLAIKLTESKRNSHTSSNWNRLDYGGS